MADRLEERLPPERAHDVRDERDEDRQRDEPKMSRLNRAQDLAEVQIVEEPPEQAQRQPCDEQGVPGNRNPRRLGRHHASWTVPTIRFSASLWASESY